MQRIITNPPIARFFFENTKSAWFWLLVRLYVGWAWLQAGLHKVGDVAWTGSEAGAGITSFVNGALQKTSGPHPDVQLWYAWFLENCVLPYADIWSYAIAWGEVLVGIGLLIGVLTGIAAFFGILMNTSFLLAGTVSTNPTLLILSIGIMLAWKVAGYIGGDRWVLPTLGTPWKPGAQR